MAVDCTGYHPATQRRRRAMRMQGKVAVVTGGARGIGGATAEALARDGARVVIGDLREPEAQATLGRIAQAGGEAFFVPTDVTDEAAARRVMDSAVERWGRLDVLVHAAGILKGATLPVDALDAAVFDEVIQVNLRGAFLCSKAAAAIMRERGGGVMLLIASGAGVRGGSSSVAYGSSKGGVHGLSLVLAPQLDRKSTRLNSSHLGISYAVFCL